MAQMNPNDWRISGEERAKHEQQFFTLKPVNGFITGEQARGFFMKSGLPSNVLAQIWGMADMNKDGKMDRKEFSIAMFLIQKKLQGFVLPAGLPESLKFDPQQQQQQQPAYGTYNPAMGGPMMTQQVPPMMAQSQMGTWPRGPAPMGMVPMGMSPMTPPLVPPGPGMAPMGMMTPPMAGSMPPSGPISPAIPTQPTPASPRRDSHSASGDWSMPQQNKLKYSQLFNTLDKNRVGSLTGVHARNILSQSGLSNQQLAQIWSLSDLDKDGRLTADEFCIAMFMVDMATSGRILPSATPPELYPYNPRTRTESVGSMGANDSIQSQEEPAQKVPIFRSFEDRRKDNFDKGQAELDRRRQILRDQESKEREERGRKEREEHEKRERERLEMERRRQLEMEKQMARQRELEMQRQEEQRKMLEQREAARREMDRQRQLELERQRIRELTDQRQRVQEAVCHAKQAQKNMTFQLQALNEKSTEMNQQITEMRDNIVHVTGDIENMKQSRDSKLTDIERLKMAIQESQSRLNVIGQERHNVTEQRGSVSGSGAVAESYSQVLHSFRNKQANMERLRQSLTEVEAEMKQKKSFTEERQNHLKSLKNTLSTVSDNNRQIYAKLTAKQHEAQGLVAQKRTPIPQKQPSVESSFAVNDAAWGSATQNSGSSGFDDSFGPDAWATQHTAPRRQSSGASDTTTSLPAPTETPTAQHVPQGTVRYKAQYEFSSRSADELSFQPGDIILVFKDHAAEPGWLAGQIKDKVGWFPESFAHCIEESTASPGVRSPGATSPTSPTAMPPKLPSIHESIHEEVNEPVSNSFNGATETSNIPQEETSFEKGKYMVAIAQYPWKAKKDTHLPFQKGDSIKILEQQEMWWRGELNGKTGWFPKSYVKLSDMPRSSPAASDDSKEVTSTVQDTQQNGSAVTESEGEWFVSQYPFAAPEPGDLGFAGGERVWVTSQDSDWWTGTIGDRTGIFPATYVVKGDDPPQPPPPPEPVDPPAPASVPASQSPKDEQVEVGKVIAPFTGSATNQLSLQPGDLVRIQTKSPSGWWEGERQRPGEERISGWFPGNYIKMLPTGNSKTPVSATVSDASMSQSGGEQVEALFDYVGQQQDELSFNRGDLLTITHKQDQDWWRGTLADGTNGLFPSNYVQPRSTQQMQTQARKVVRTPSNDRKTHMPAQELIETERNYIDDLIMVRQVFRKPFESSSALTSEELHKIFGNWDELISVAQNFHKDMKANANNLGKIILKHIGKLRIFVTFCKHQQAGIEQLEQKERISPQFRAVHTKCSQHSVARGLPLTYFLLLPMTRVTKYPLVVDQIIKYSQPADPNLNDLKKSYEKLKALCGEVNNAVTEVENLQMLHWCQSHVRCDTIKPNFVFHSYTNYSAPRKFLESGIVHKAKSGRLLIGLLFNDLLMLTTPDEQIDHPDSFKLTKTSELILCLYKAPILLHLAAMQIPPSATGSSETSEETKLLAISTGEDVITFRADSSNARIFWTKQLEKAIKEAKDQFQRAHINDDNRLSTRGSGRILIEVVCVRQLTIPADFGQNPTVLCKMKLERQNQVKSLDLNKKDTLCTTQFVVESSKTKFSLGLYISRQYAPDLCVGMLELPLGELIKSSGSHRGPILRQISLSGSELDSGQQEKTFVIIKFVVQMYD